MTMFGEQRRRVVAQVMAEYARRVRKRPPSPLYQKVVFWILLFGALIGLVAVFFFR